jgi:hypothetical protein
VGGIVSGQRVSEVPRSGTPSQEAKELKGIFENFLKNVFCHFIVSVGDGSSLRVISDENNTPTPGANSKTLVDYRISLHNAFPCLIALFPIFMSGCKPITRRAEFFRRARSSCIQLVSVYGSEAN